MKITSIVICSVPFDNTYKNVFDYKDDSTSEEIFSSNYYNNIIKKYKKLTYNVTRAIKIVDNKAKLTIPYTINYAENYNYVAVFTGVKWFFFFITAYTSENDGSPSATTFDLEWDSWSNNLYRLNLDKSLNKIVCKHYNRLDYNSVTKNAKPIYYGNETTPAPITENEAYIDNNDRYEVMMIRAFVDKDYFGITDKKFNFTIPEVYIADTKEKAETNQGTKYTDFACDTFCDLTSKDIIKAFYCPLALYDKKEKKIIECTFKTSQLTIPIIIDPNTSPKQMFLSMKQVVINNTVFMINQTLNYSLKSEKNSYISSYEIIYNCPVKFEINYNSNNQINYVLLKAPVIQTLQTEVIFDNSNVLTFFSFAIPLFSVTGEIKYGCQDYFDNKDKYALLVKSIENKKIDYNSFIGLQYNIDSTVMLLRESPDLVYYDTSLPDYMWQENIEPRLWEYPFRFVSVIYNDNKYNLIPSNYKDNVFKIEINYTSYEPLIKILLNNAYIKNFVGEYVSNSGTVSYSVNAKDDYLLRNGNTRMAKIISSTIQSSSNIIKGFATYDLNSFSSGILGIFNTALSDYAKMADLTNTPNITKSNTLAENDTYRQDRIILTKSECIQNILYDQIKKLFELYGYKQNSIGNVMDNTRVYYDYVQTENCNLKAKINIKDKQILENAFNNGITKFHYFWYSDTIKFFDQAMTQEVYNIESDLYIKILEETV